ncbi:MAG: cysteine desulfurase [Clostridia bacterium]|nr:cysteine desulfurase [Clostridia bacterium]
MEGIYLDNSATTQVSEAAAKAAFAAMTENYGNPSSLHKMGIEAEKILEGARFAIAERLYVQPKNIYFTSGGTEANNLAVFGAVEAKKRYGKKIVATAIEHHSVLDSVKAMEKQGYECVYLEPDEYGNISEEKIYNAVDDTTILVSIMAINNELGSVLPIKAASRAIKRAKANAYLHVDAVQAFCKTDLNPKADGVDLMSISAHKIHGAKGCGALYVADGVKIKPQTFGGEQEKKLRPGTQAVPLIAAFGQAVCDYPKNDNTVKELCLYAKDVLSGIEGVVFNSGENASEYIINLSVLGIRSEIMLHYLEQQGIYVSSGSACAMGKPSHVLAAAGIPAKRADSALRISFSHFNKKTDIDALAAAIISGQKSLIRSK